MTKPRWSKKSFSPIVVAFWLRKSREDLDFRRRGEIQMGKVWQTYAWIAGGASRGRYFNNLAEEIEREFWLPVRLLMVSLNGGIRRIVPLNFIGWLVRFRFATKFFLEWKLDLHSQILVEISQTTSQTSGLLSALFVGKGFNINRFVFLPVESSFLPGLAVETAFFVFRTLRNSFAQHPKTFSKPKSWIFSRDSLILDLTHNR